MAMHDPLTRLYNRFAFEDHFNNILSNKEADDKQHALLYIDLDQFKIVNDTCGHTAGDKMLAMLARTMNNHVAEHGILSRLGGDEFGIILYNKNIEAAQIFAEGLLKLIKEFRFAWEDKRFTVGASIGLVMFDDSAQSSAELLSAADMACYAAKEKGRDRIHIFIPDDKDMLQRHGEMQFVERINTALEEDRFVLHRQAIVPLQDNDTSQAYEYLLRLLDEEGTLLYPGTFMPAAERYSLMLKLDHWVVNNVFNFLASQNSEPSSNTEKVVAFINLSGQAFSESSFASFIIESANSYQINPGQICFEITETSAISNLNDASGFIKKLRQEGFKFALDDFGSGMSSYSYLHELHVDYLKIDGTFSQNIDKDELNSAIIEAITNIGHKTNLKVIAEWIESKEAEEMVKQFGVDYGQGFALGKPEPLPVFESEYPTIRQQH